ISRDDIRLVQYKWYFNKKSEYAQRDIERKGRNTKSLLHREIVEGILGRPLKETEYVEHLNEDKLDNRRENLSDPINASEYKQKIPSRRNTSGYRGVSYEKNGNKWRAQITKDTYQKTIGYYNTPQEAAQAYNNAALELYGEKAHINEIHIKE